MIKELVKVYNCKKCGKEIVYHTDMDIKKPDICSKCREIK